MPIGHFFNSIIGRLTPPDPALADVDAGVLRTSLRRLESVGEALRAFPDAHDTNAVAVARIRAELQRRASL